MELHLNLGWAESISRRPVGNLMAKRRYSRNYKRVNVGTKSFGGSGGQILLASFSKSDAQSSQVTWLNNVNVSAILNDGDLDQGGMLFYLTTSSTWNDTEVISANAMSGFGGKVSLSAKRRIRINSAKDDGSFGMVYLWGEVTDISLTAAVMVRLVIEQWGKNCLTEDEF